MNDELYHYGVKGMKWGVRHDDRNRRNKRSKKDRYGNYKDDYKRIKGKKYHVDYLRAHDKKTPVRLLSNKELEARVKRLKNEDALETYGDTPMNNVYRKIRTGLAIVGTLTTAAITIKKGGQFARKTYNTYKAAENAKKAKAYYKSMKNIARIAMKR